MRHQDVGRLLLNFSLPAIIAMLVNSLYNIMDRIFVGRGVGALAIAGTTVGFPIMIILMAVSILIGVGATSLISIRLGEQNRRGAEKVVGNAMIMLIILPLICTLVYLTWAEPILLAFGASPATLPYARDFMNIIMAGAVFGSISMGMNNFIRAEGNPRLAMYTQLVAVGINLVLNYTFIFKFGWGIKGSALATVISWCVSTVWILSYFLSGRSVVRIRTENLRLRWPILSSIMAIGFASFAMQIAASVQQLILNKTLLSYGGDLALSAVGILMSISTLLIMPILGLSQGAQPIVGFNYGARQYGRVKATLSKAITVATIISLVGFIVIQIWPEPIAGLFSKGNQELTRLASHALVVYFAALPVIGFQIIGSAGFYQAIGKAKEAMILSLSRQVLMFIPMLLILPHFWGIEGVWRTAPIADTLSSILVGGFLVVEMRKMSVMQEQVSSGDMNPISEPQ